MGGGESVEGEKTQQRGKSAGRGKWVGFVLCVVAHAKVIRTTRRRGTGSQ